MKSLAVAFVFVSVTLVVVQCLPLDAAAASATTSVDDLLRLYNVSRQDIEASRKQHLAAAHHHLPTAAAAAGRQHLPPISSVQKAIRNRSNDTANKSSSAAIQRKQEVFRQVMGFVEQNGRPPQLTAGGSPPSVSPPKLPFPPAFTRPDSTLDSVGRIRYIQPSCDSPKHANEEMWTSSSSSPSLSLHLFFNLSGIHSQTRNGYQLYVIGAKLRLLKFAEGEAQPSVDYASELLDSASQESPIQSLRAVPFFLDPLTPSDEEKVRVSVHNYTRALKRNRVHKKKLLDSQMALAKEEGYMELDIKLAARWWLAPGGRNFGLSLEVEDTDGQRKPATHFFRPRNCSADAGSIRTDELTDTADVASPVLELTVVEVPEGRNVFELPSSAARGRADEMLELSGGEDADAVRGEVTDEAPRKHRHHSSRIQHTSHEEQADEAVTVRLHHPSRTATTSAPTGGSKYRSATHRSARPTLSPVPTLATLEDHDLFRETEEEETARAEADETRMMQRPITNIFMQRLMQHHQQQHSRPVHHPRGKDNRRLAY